MPGDRVALGRGPRAPWLWAHARALLISVVLLVECTSALPDKRVARRHLQRPETARVVSAAERALQLLGFAPDRRSLETALLSGSSTLVQTRRALLAPFAPLFRYTATHQQWGLFLLGTRECFRIHVDARTPDDRWVPLYHALEASVPRYEAVLRYRRVRGIYNPSSQHGSRPQYPGFVRALARFVFEREAGYDTLRVRMQHLRIGEPGTAPLSGGFVDEVVVQRWELFPREAGAGTGTRTGTKGPTQ